MSTLVPVSSSSVVGRHSSQKKREPWVFSSSAGPRMKGRPDREKTYGKRRDRRSHGSRSHSRSRSPLHPSRSLSPSLHRSHRSDRHKSDRSRSDRPSVSAPTPAGGLDVLTLEAIEEAVSRTVAAQLGQGPSGAPAPVPTPPIPAAKGSGRRKLPP